MFIFTALGSLGLDNGLGLRPPLGWRNFNAFYNPSQKIMEDTMDAMVNRSRLGFFPRLWGGGTLWCHWYLLRRRQTAAVCIL